MAAAHGSSDGEMIHAEDLWRTYVMGAEEIHALHGVSFDVAANEYVAIMGPSGSGKSTLMNLIGCLDTPTRGRYVLRGKVVSEMNDDELAEIRNREIGFVFQTFNLLPVINAVENVELPLLVGGMRTSDARQRATAALEQVGLADRLHHRPGELSGGQRQRVTVARALANNPAMVWADEPTGNLDSTSAGEVLKLMRNLKQENGQTFVIVTHDPEVGALCDRIVHMQDGEILSTGDRATPATVEDAKASVRGGVALPDAGEEG
jgi:putative ABC transport system ATP-binding protein